MTIDLKLYNSLTRQKEILTPVEPDHVKMYACGPTVYNYVHVGNARMAVVFDQLYRVLKHLYPKVTYARNITDIDDKIMQASEKQGVSCEEIASKYDAAYQQDLKNLNCLEPDFQPHATDYVDKMIAMVQGLVDEGHAYEAEGHVLFHVPSYEAYGKLSGRSRDDQIAGARVEVAPYKKYPADFILWKPSTESQPGWESPWGRGRPGWHLECSVMSTDLLGKNFDIHGGGQDLKFPHHENEIAQSCCAHKGSNFASIWMHNGFLNINGEKMSKSLGNFHTAHEVLEKYDGEVVRLVLLSAHYRQPLDFSFDQLDEAKKQLDRWYGALSRHNDVSAPMENIEIPEAFIHALADDMNTPKAYAVLHELFSKLNKADTGDARSMLKGQILSCANLMGLLMKDPDAWLKGGRQDIDEAWVNAQIEARTQAKKDKDFAKADQIRDELLAKNIILEDTPNGVKWRQS